MSQTRSGSDANGGTSLSRRSSIDLELPALFPSIFTTARERQILADPWQLDNPAIRQLSSAARRRNRPRLHSAGSRLLLVDGRKSRAVTRMTSPPVKLEKLPGNVSPKEVHVNLPNDFPVLPRIRSPSLSPEHGTDSEGQRREQFVIDLAGRYSSESQVTSSVSIGLSEGRVLTGDSTFGSAISSKSRETHQNSLDSNGSQFTRSYRTESKGSTDILTDDDGRNFDTSIFLSPNYDNKSGRGFESGASMTPGYTTGRNSSVRQHPIQIPSTLSMGENGDEEQDMKSITSSSNTEKSEDSSSTNLTSERQTLSPQPPPHPKTRLHPARRRQADQETLRKQMKDHVRNVMEGNMTGLVAAPSRMVNIYIASTGTDMLEETSMLRKSAFPRLRQFCDEQGFVFKAVDLHSIPQDRISNETDFTRMCLRELQECQRRSLGPSFVALVGNKYGKYLLPTTIPQEDFNVLHTVLEMEAPENADLLIYHYQLDESYIPSIYRLKEIKEASDTEDADTTLYELVSIITSASRVAHAQDMMTDDCFQRLHSTALEMELFHGIFNVKDAKRKSLAFCRELEGLVDDLENQIAPYFIDVERHGATVTENLECADTLNHIKQNKLRRSLGDNNIHVYAPWWQEGGLDTAKCHRNLNYLKLFSRHFHDDIKKLVITATKSLNSTWNSIPQDTIDLYDDVHYHLNKAEKESQIYNDLNDNMSSVQKHLKDDVEKALFIHGPPGCGKTAFLSHLARSISNLIEKPTVCIIRFLNPASQDLTTVLKSVCKQICIAYELEDVEECMGTDDIDVYVLLRNLLDQVSKLSQATSQKVLVILMDSIDMFNDYSWLPRSSPFGVCFIFTCSQLPSFLEPSNSSVIHLQPLTIDKARDFSINVYNMEGKRFNETHWSELCQRLNKDISYLEAKLLTASALDCEIQTEQSSEIPTSITEVVTRIFDCIEQHKDIAIVKGAIGYLSISPDGLTEADLAEILSRNKDIVDLLLDRHTRPEINHTEVNIDPSLLSYDIAQLRYALDPLLSKEECRGHLYLQWTSTIIQQIAVSRFLNNEDLVGSYHADLLDFYLERGNRLTDQPQESSDEKTNQSKFPSPKSLIDRIQRLTVYHLSQSDISLSSAKEMVLCNFQWLAKRLHFSNISSLIEDFKMINREYHSGSDNELVLLQDCFTANSGMLSGVHRLFLSDSAMDLFLILKGSLMVNSELHEMLQQLLDEGYNTCVDKAAYALIPVAPSSKVVCEKLIEGQRVSFYRGYSRLHIVEINSTAKGCIFDLPNFETRNHRGVFCVDEGGCDGTNMVISPDGKSVITFEEGFVTLQELYSGYVHKQLNLEDNGEKVNLKHFTVNFDDMMMIALSSHDILMTIDLKSNEIVGRYPDETEEVNIVCEERKTLHVEDIEDGEFSPLEIQKINTHEVDRELKEITQEEAEDEHQKSENGDGEKNENDEESIGASQGNNDDPHISDPTNDVLQERSTEEDNIIQKNQISQEIVENDKGGEQNVISDSELVQGKEKQKEDIPQEVTQFDIGTKMKASGDNQQSTDYEGSGTETHNTDKEGQKSPLQGDPLISESPFPGKTEAEIRQKSPLQGDPLISESPIPGKIEAEMESSGNIGEGIHESSLEASHDNQENEKDTRNEEDHSQNNPTNNEDNVEVENTIAEPILNDLALETNAFTVDKPLITNGIRCLKLSPDQKIIGMVARGVKGCSLLLWNTQTWDKTATVNLPATDCSDIYFSPSSSEILIDHLPRDYSLIRPATGILQHTIEDDKGDLTTPHLRSCVAFSKDSQYIVLPTGKSFISVFNVESGKSVQQCECQERCTLLAMDSSEYFIFACEGLTCISIWQIATASTIWSITLECTLVNDLAVGFQNQETFMYTIHDDKICYSWNVTNLLFTSRKEVIGSVVCEKARVAELHTLKDGGDNRGSSGMELIGNLPSDMEKGQEEVQNINASLPKENSDTSGVNAMHHDVVLTPDGRFIITAHRAVGIRVYDVTTVKLVSCIECPDVWNVLIANDGLTLVCTTHSKHIMFYTLEKGRWQMVDRLYNITHLAVDGITISADSRTIVVVRKDDFHRDKLHMYAIDLVTCHVMAHLTVNVEIEDAQYQCLSTQLSYDHANLVITYHSGKDTPSQFVICDLYKEINMDLPSWTLGSPSPLRTSGSRIVTPMGICIEDYGPGSAGNIYSSSEDPDAIDMSPTPGLLGIPESMRDRSDHVYPTRCSSSSSDCSENMNFGSISINVFEDNTIPEHLTADLNASMNPGLLGASLTPPSSRDITLDAMATPYPTSSTPNIALDIEQNTEFLQVKDSESKKQMDQEVNVEASATQISDLSTQDQVAKNTVNIGTGKETASPARMETSLGVIPESLEEDTIPGSPRPTEILQKTSSSESEREQINNKPVGLNDTNEQGEKILEGNGEVADEQTKNNTADGTDDEAAGAEIRAGEYTASEGDNTKDDVDEKASAEGENDGLNPSDNSSPIPSEINENNEQSMDKNEDDAQKNAIIPNKNNEVSNDEINEQEKTQISEDNNGKEHTNSPTIQEITGGDEVQRETESFIEQGAPERHETSSSNTAEGEDDMKPPEGGHNSPQGRPNSANFEPLPDQAAAPSRPASASSDKGRSSVSEDRLDSASSEKRSDSATSVKRSNSTSSQKHSLSSNENADGFTSSEKAPDLAMANSDSAQSETRPQSASSHTFGNSFSAQNSQDPSSPQKHDSSETSEQPPSVSEEQEPTTSPEKRAESASSEQRPHSVTSQSRPTSASLQTVTASGTETPPQSITQPSKDDQPNNQGDIEKSFTDMDLVLQQQNDGNVEDELKETQEVAQSNVKLTRLDSLSVIPMPRPVRQASEMSLNLPFDFDDEPPADSENPTGRRRPVGHLPRYLSLTVEHPEKCIATLTPPEMLVGTARGHLVILDLLSGVVKHVMLLEGQDNIDIVKNVIDSEVKNIQPSAQAEECKPHKTAITHVCRSRDFRLAVAASKDKTLTVWQVEGLRLLHRLIGHTDEVTWSDISGDNSLLVSGSDDRTVRLWELETGTALHSFNVKLPVFEVRFSFGDVHVMARMGRRGYGRFTVFRINRPAQSNQCQSSPSEVVSK